ncbi:leucine-rich repeat-containing protein (LRR) [Tieghemostelium lacteum]|uniref:Leucine-rich repeat-containing protein (LRR) n=1 Tax=Tieghemostelium lacteum TaxID=361077 RepID=A0A152AAA7_TIELA|nr:leucine-rich repeat-containing protein (LRR) [Tieghemostelium lacteum]|eukprot:KYR03007.1 leucine-rich repeat-containing protein (LRR) [Tieghemostelium lacteum]
MKKVNSFENQNNYEFSPPPKIHIDNLVSSGGSGSLSPPSPRSLTSSSESNSGGRLRRASSPLAFLQSLSPKNKKKNKKKTEFDPLSLMGDINTTNSDSRSSSIDSGYYKPLLNKILNINNLPHRILIKIFNYLIIDKFDTVKLEIRKSKQKPQQLVSLDNNNNNNNNNSKSSSSIKGFGKSKKKSISKDEEDEEDKQNDNIDLESICLVCKLWGLEIAPQVFHYFIVKSPKDLKSLIGLVTQGLQEGGRKFQFYYISMIIDKSSTYQKFMNILKHRMPDKLPDKFVKATTKPILSNLFSKSLFAQFFENSTSTRYFRFYQKWMSKDNFSAIGMALRSNTSICHLSFRNNNLEDVIVEDVIKALYDNQTITYLDLCGNKLGYQTAHELAMVLTKNRHLETIDLFYNNINTDGGSALFKALRINSTLKNLYLRWNHIKTPAAIDLAETIKLNNTLQSIQLDRIEDAGGGCLFEALCENSSIVEINLSDCAFQQKSSVAISKVLSSKISKLSVLNLKSNQLGLLIRPLAISLGSCQHLTKLNLADNRISDDTGYLLGESLGENKSLTSLSLSMNGLSNHFSESLSLALRINQTLLALDISANKITFEGAKMIAESLQSNSSLKLLNLNQNSLSPQFGPIIAETLKLNQTLTHLEMAYTGLRNEGSLPISKVLALPTLHIKKLNLSENSISDQVGIEFANALATNQFLQDLDLSYNTLSSKSKEIFEQSLLTNLSIINLTYSSVPLKWKFQI